MALFRELSVNTMNARISWWTSAKVCLQNSMPVFQFAVDRALMLSAYFIRMRCSTFRADDHNWTAATQS